ncbi:hypothetical protein [Chitinimonas koreensis]|uniref:hypothetical protein n=1 Tax=Chitinimonas koreensis TaxID=356302 RepID=UPI00040BCEFA|nr:hypothetical protein [Chitinimonas koreensis]QNM99070.1 hypothetical protein H9L41_06895 [Chitinimonas koreensis]
MTSIPTPLRHGWLALILTATLAACGGGGGSGDSGGGTPPNNGGGGTNPTPVPTPTPTPPPAGMQVVDDAGWDDTAVRKVLQVFAWGGQASDAQITAWAAMAPRAAIVEMISFAPTNPKLSPPGDADVLGSGDGSLRALSAYWSGTASPLPAKRRGDFGFENWRGPHNLVLQAGHTRGLNPVRYKLGWWETNYHLVANTEAGVAWQQVGTLFDSVTGALGAGRPYREVLAEAASSAAIAKQYGHDRNKIKKGVFYGNEDFAREYHQLFFGVLGTNLAEDTANDYHESISVKNTARLLTDMPLAEWDSVEVRFGTEYHNVAPLEILHQSISGANAREKIFALAKVDIRHADSQANLPIMIAQGLADDTLANADSATEAKKAELRKVWAQLGDQPDGLLEYLRWYAISKQFHSAGRVKYWTQLDYHLLVANRMSLTQRENLIGLYEPTQVNGWRNSDAYVVFAPSHNVFGHTTGVESSQSADVFRSIYNRAVNEYSWNARQGSYTNQNEASGSKDWGSVAPKNAAGAYEVKAVAEWLWQRFIADGLTHFGDAERQQVYALLATGLAATAGTDLAAQGALTMNLGAADQKQRDTANLRVNMAAAFITATPFAFVQQGR